MNLSVVLIGMGAIALILFIIVRLAGKSATDKLQAKISREAAESNARVADAVVNDSPDAVRKRLRDGEF